MIIGSLNIRGGGNTLKRRRVSSLIKKGGTDGFLLQEKSCLKLKGFMLIVFGATLLLVILSLILVVCLAGC